MAPPNLAEMTIVWTLSLGPAWALPGLEVYLSTPCLLHRA